MKKLVLVTAAMLALLLIATTVGAADKLTIWVRTPETVKLIEEAAGKFMALNPGVELEVVPFAADAYPGAMQAAISGDNLPDVFQVHNSIPLARLESLQLIQSLDEYFSEEYTARFEPAIWWEGSTTIGGKIYAWPDRSFRRASLFMYYNKDIMKEAGLNPEKPPVTWDEFIAQGKKVSQWGQGEVYGLHLGFTSGWFNERIVLQLATTVSEDTGVPAEHLPGKMVNWKSGNMFDYEEVLPVIDFFKALSREGVIHPNYLSTKRSQAAAQWGAGQSAFLFDGSWRLSEILKSYPDLNFGIAMLPSQKGGPALWGVEGGSQNGFVVSRKSKSARAATDFFKFLTDEYYPLLLKNSIDLSPIPEINNNDENFTSPEFGDLVRLTYEGTKVLPSPVLKNPDELETVVALSTRSSREPFGPTIQGYLSSGDEGIEDYLQSYAAEQNRYLKEALEEASRKADVSMDNWIFTDWNRLEDYK